MPSSETPSDPFIARNVPHSWTTRSVRLPDADPVQAAAVMVRTVAIRTRSFTAMPPRHPRQRAAVPLGRRTREVSSRRQWLRPVWDEGGGWWLVVSGGAKPLATVGQTPDHYASLPALSMDGVASNLSWR